MFEPDVPITTANDNIFDRKYFARQLAEVILSYDQPSSFNIGLYVGWGSGKTSILNMVEEDIKTKTDNKKKNQLY